MLSSLTVIPVNHVMTDALAGVLRQAPLTPEKVAFAWRTVVGPAVERVTSVELRGQILHVRTQDPAWRREIERSAAVIRRRLAMFLGNDVVRGLEVTLP
jgi:hypothetical protein